jgi:hypothetical protein
LKKRILERQCRLRRLVRDSPCAIGRICPYEKRPSQLLVTAGAFGQIRFFGFLLRNSFDIALTPMALVGSKKFCERRIFLDQGFTATKRAASLPPFRGL